MAQFLLPLHQSSDYNRVVHVWLPAEELAERGLIVNLVKTKVLTGKKTEYYQMESSNAQYISCKQ